MSTTQLSQGTSNIIRSSKDVDKRTLRQMMDDVAEGGKGCPARVEEDFRDLTKKVREASNKYWSDTDTNTEIKYLTDLNGGEPVTLTDMADDQAISAHITCSQGNLTQAMAQCVFNSVKLMRDICVQIAEELDSLPSDEQAKSSDYDRNPNQLQRYAKAVHDCDYDKQERALEDMQRTMDGIERYIKSIQVAATRGGKGEEASGSTTRALNENTSLTASILKENKEINPFDDIDVSFEFCA